jgi:hypothetical protein
MIGPAELEQIRKLTPGERVELGLELLDLAWGFLMHLPAEEIQRRLDLGKQRWNPPPAPMEE